ncbi:MFS general substrate transporter [Aspergillus steynii IBT 23096]|uniref:MFS general substrate transporter n=1 Tax=Aspergillus steynii IBT 23096 TaxID=1392250 RepID=A0A2I2G0R5_9EURO|nr:MFS general substrate transporter [Aspergillus steynii IBT 23096]PLB46458.1 MFS general substrate transporter [Aspergillus steynii IBT 23096]
MRQRPPHHETTSSPSPSNESTEKNQSLLSSVKQSPKIAAYCLALTSGILLYGYDLVIVGNVSSMPKFQRDFGRKLNNTLIIPSLWLGLWNIANPIGGIFGSLLAGFVQDRTGRRFALALASLISALGVAVAYVSNLPDAIDARRAVFFVAKFVQGFAVNMIMCTTQTYMSEVLPPVLRGPILAFFPLFMLLGQLIGSVVVFTQLDAPGAIGYQRCIISQWPFSAIPMLVAAFLPESPTYLVRRDRVDDARKAQRRLDSTAVNSDANLEHLRLSLRLESEKSDHAGAGYMECFRGVNRRRTMIVLFANLVPQLFGLTLLAKASYFLQTVGMDATNSLLFLQVGIALGLVANIVSMWTLTRFGRVPLLLFGLSVSTVLWTAMGILGCFRGVVTIWWSAVSLMLVIMICGLSTWPASYVVAAETSALCLRSKTQGLGWLVNGLSNGVFGLVLPYIFNPDEGALRAKTGFVYTGFCVLAVAGTWLFVPEMKDRKPMEIDRMFEMRLSTRRFKGWVEEESSA